jgi:outer membrane lipoprotein carrier protein
MFLRSIIFFQREWLMLFILIVFTSSSFSADKDNDLLQLLSQTHSMQAEFKQTVYDEHHQLIQQAYGKMALVQPGKFRWEVIKPIPQLIIANGKRLWIYDADLDQVTIRALNQTVGDAPGLLLSHQDKTIIKNYLIKEISHQAQKQIFELRPYKKDAMFALVKMIFSHQQIREMHLIDHLGHETHIIFQNIKMNQAMPSTLFIFKNRPGIDVIDETKR